MHAIRLGAKRSRNGDLDGAATAYQFAIDSGHSEAAPLGAFRLGLVRKRMGDAAGAAAALRLAIESGHGRPQAMAAFSLGGVHHDQGDLQAAAAAYQLAIDSAHPEAAPLSALCLGEILEAQGALTEAAGAYEVAIRSGHSDAAPKAAYSLGRVLEIQGDRTGAVAAYKLAMNTRHAENGMAALMAIKALDPSLALKAIKALDLGKPLGAGPRPGPPPARSGAGSIVILDRDALPDHDGPRIRWRDTSVVVACPTCAVSLPLADTHGQALSGLEQALVTKEGLSLECMFKLTCPHCDTRWLGSVPAGACYSEEDNPVVSIQIGMTKADVESRLGAPHNRTDTKSVLASYDTVVGDWPGGQQDYWYFADVPPGQETMITFGGGRVIDVDSRPTL